MSVRVCVHPVMRDSTSLCRYGSASSSVSGRSLSPTTRISASAVAAISQRDANALASAMYQPAAKQSTASKSTTSPESRPCTLPEIPNSPSSRSVNSSGSPFLLQVRKISDNSSDASLQGSSTGRHSMFPNFRALQRLALSAKSRTLSLNQNFRRSSSTTQGSQDKSRANPGASSTMRQSRSSDELQTTTSCSPLAALPGNRPVAPTDSNSQKCTSFEDLHQSCAADQASVSSKVRRKKSAKRRKRKSRAKSRGQYTGQKHPKEGKQKTPLAQENSLGTLLSAMPVVVQPKKIEIYSSRYSKCDVDTTKSHQSHSPGDDKVAKYPKTSSPRKDPSEGATGRKLGILQDRDQVIYASRVSPRIPGGIGLSVGQREAEDSSRVTRVYLSEKQSGNLRECGLILPCAPPGTPTPQMLQKYQYVPSMMDLRSQRTVRDRLSGIEQRAKKKQQQQREEAKKTEQQLQRDQAVAWKQRQRLEIYALNKIMTEFEEKNFQEFMKTNSEKTP